MIKPTYKLKSSNSSDNNERDSPPVSIGIAPSKRSSNEEISMTTSIFERSPSIEPITQDKQLNILPLESRQDRLRIVEIQIESRWEKAKESKKSFALYENKPDEEIMEEFRKLHEVRRNLWYCSPENMLYISKPDYEYHTPLITGDQFDHASSARAFKYNSADDSYNASTILLFGHHFIALREPSNESVHAFFKVLINQHVDILVRLKPEGEYKEKGSLGYWEDKVLTGLDYQSIQLDSQSTHEGIAIPYIYTNNWPDNSGISVQDLYSLVQNVRKIYKERGGDGPIACHCSAGVGRTGTFIVAYLIAEILDLHNLEDLSIEELVLRVSIQRAKMVFNKVQYLLLYKFVEYYMAQKILINNNDTKT